MAVPHPETQGEAAIPAHAEAEQNLFASVPPICAMPVGWPWCPWGLGSVCIRPLEGNRGGSLMPPRGQDRRDFQGFEGNSPQDLVESGGKQGIQDVPQAVIMQRGPR